MAAEVSSLIRILGRYKEEDNRTVGNGQESTALVTRDLLGQSSNLAHAETQELDLDLQVPSGWEKRLDLKSGKVYIQRNQTPDSPLNSESKHQMMNNNNIPIEPRFQDLNFPPSPSKKKTLNLFNETSLDLKLTNPSSNSPSSSSYSSVCTLDKVKSALERADKEMIKKRSPNLWKKKKPLSSSSPSQSSSSSSAKEIQEEHNYDGGGGGNNEIRMSTSASPIAVGCPGCLSYVLVMKNYPRCPRCNSVVPLPSIKKPRIDLNMSM